MNPDYIKKILLAVKEGKKDVDTAMHELKDLPYADLGYARVDHHRELRRGYPEVIFCAGKTPNQVKGIVANMLPNGNNILGTRANNETFDAVKKICKLAIYNEAGKTITINQTEQIVTKSYIAIITAGTSDIPIAEEAAVTTEFFGNKTERLFDVGIAGIHRLYDKMDLIRGAKVLIVIAGMEGALPSVVGGLVDKPVIAVPTSIGYGAAFNGIAALLGMLTSCTSGIGVVNIDNGFGAAYLASMINKL
jgi:pyridinium-3,5-biscarboxylic acid mononucleotide synthase